jgi:hypothetical protein
MRLLLLEARVILKIGGLNKKKIMLFVDEQKALPAPRQP